MSNTLYIKIDDSLDEETYNLLKDYYSSYKKKYETDSGLDLITPNDVLCNASGVNTVNLGIQCMPSGDNGYYLFSRSSISNTSFRLANCVGIIDCSYRGNLIAKVDFHTLSSVTNSTLEKGTKLFQICMPDLKAFNIKVVDSLEETERGANGFGSTGK
jgi:dUTP pyrophosphatase